MAGALSNVLTSTAITKAQQGLYEYAAVARLRGSQSGDASMSPHEIEYPGGSVEHWMFPLTVNG